MKIQMEVDGRLSRKIIKYYFIIIYVFMLYSNFNFFLSYGDYGFSYAGISNLIILSLIYLCGRYNSKAPVGYFLICCLWGIVSYSYHVSVYDMTMCLSSRGMINTMLIFPSSSLVGTMVAIFPDNDIANTIQLSLIIQPIAIAITYLVGIYIRKRGSGAKISK